MNYNYGYNTGASQGDSNPGEQPHPPLPLPIPSSSTGGYQQSLPSTGQDQLPVPELPLPIPRSSTGLYQQSLLSTGFSTDPYQSPGFGTGQDQLPVAQLPLPIPSTSTGPEYQQSLPSSSFGLGQYQSTTSTGFGSQYYGPAINIQGATPATSPQMTYTTPVFTTRTLPTNQPTSTTISFPPLMQCPTTLPADYTARMMLDHPPLMPIFDESSGTVYNSSAANDHYGAIAPLREWPLPEGLGGYNVLSDFDRYTPFPNNPLAATVTEADVISTTMNAIFNPVETVLSRNNYNCQIKAACEDSHTVSVPTHLGSVSHLSRIDRSYSYWDGQSQMWIPFAIIEFKRPGALVYEEWRAAFANGTEVGGKGTKLCRQLKKYGYGLVTPFVGAFDGRVLLLLFLDGTREQWYHADTSEARSTPAYFRWIYNPVEMKRNAYVFLRDALRWKLRQEGRL
jgi:hypothetical protein